MSDLSQKTCVPCEQWVPPLKGERLEELVTQINVAWQVVEEKKLVREVKLKDFSEAVRLLNQVAELAENEGHHPNMRLHSWNKLEIELYTHKITGLHENDFVLAAKIDDILSGR
jgi:4a-hydroxytetrahydrobiopterin dehydratase